MRIRTIKPGFWANEKMSRLPDFTRLLAIGLLNYADDHGYFWANPLMIRGSLFPFEEDSSKIRRALAQLASEGYLRLGVTDDEREVGHVIKFKVHQRVDKAADSEIEPLAIFDERSTNDLGLIVDESPLDRKGKERIGKEQEAAPAALVVMPEKLATDLFQAAWTDYMAYRAERKLPKLQPRSQLAQLQKLAEWGHNNAIESIRETIRQNWQGLFPPKPDANHPSGHPGRNGRSFESRNDYSARG